MDMMDAINYVQEHNLHTEANKLANKVGDIYIACVMLYKNVPQTKENIAIGKKIANDKKQREKEYFDWFINGGYADGKI